MIRLIPMTQIFQIFLSKPRTFRCYFKGTNFHGNLFAWGFFFANGSYFGIFSLFSCTIRCILEYILQGSGSMAENFAKSRKFLPAEICTFRVNIHTRSRRRLFSFSSIQYGKIRNIEETYQIFKNRECVKWRCFNFSRWSSDFLEFFPSFFDERSVMMKISLIV